MFKRLMIVALLILVSTPAFAYRKGSRPSSSYEYGNDAHGSLTRRDNFYKDTDGDGVSNYYDRNDRNSNRW